MNSTLAFIYHLENIEKNGSHLGLVKQASSLTFKSFLGANGWHFHSFEGSAQHLEEILFAKDCVILQNGSRVEPHSQAED